MSEFLILNFQSSTLKESQGEADRNLKLASPDAAPEIILFLCGSARVVLFLRNRMGKIIPRKGAETQSQGNESSQVSQMPLTQHTGTRGPHGVRVTMSRRKRLVAPLMGVESRNVTVSVPLPWLTGVPTSMALAIHEGVSSVPLVCTV